MKSGKCPHDHLIVCSPDHGVWFEAYCADCGLRGKLGNTPSAARSKFNKSLGKRPNASKTGDDMYE